MGCLISSKVVLGLPGAFYQLIYPSPSSSSTSSGARRRAIATYVDASIEIPTSVSVENYSLTLSWSRSDTWSVATPLAYPISARLRGVITVLSSREIGSISTSVVPTSFDNHTCWCYTHRDPIVDATQRITSSCHRSERSDGRTELRSSGRTPPSVPDWSRSRGARSRLPFVGEILPEFPVEFFFRDVGDASHALCQSCFLKYLLTKFGSLHLLLCCPSCSLHGDSQSPCQPFLIHNSRAENNDGWI